MYVIYLVYINLSGLSYMRLAWYIFRTRILWQENPLIYHTYLSHLSVCFSNGFPPCALEYQKRLPFAFQSTHIFCRIFALCSCLEQCHEATNWESDLFPQLQWKFIYPNSKRIFCADSKWLAYAYYILYSIGMFIFDVDYGKMFGWDKKSL